VMPSIGCRPVLICVLFTLSVVSAPSLAVAQTTMLISQTESGPATTYSPPQYPFAVSRTDDQGIRVQIGTPPFFFGVAGYDLRFSTGAGKPLTPGTYLSATRPPAPYNGMSWDSLIIPTQRPCFFQPGRFLVREAEYAPDGPVIRLAIDIEAHCLDEAAAWYGILRYNSTVPPDRFPGETVRYSLSIAPPDHGLVTGAGISCGDGQTACSMTFASASSETLTAIPDPGFVFAGWKPGCAGEATTTLFVNTVKECGAAFAKAIPSEPLTSLILKGEQEDPVTKGENDLYSVENSRPWAEHLFTAKGEQVTVYIWGLSYLPLSPVFSFTGRWPESVLWKLAFRAPFGTPLSVGRYTDISSARYGASNMSGLDVWGKGDCLALSPLRVGEFVINEIAFNSDGSLRGAAGTPRHSEFPLDADGGSVQHAGSVRFARWWHLLQRRLAAAGNAATVKRGESSAAGVTGRMHDGGSICLTRRWHVRQRWVVPAWNACPGWRKQSTTATHRVHDTGSVRVARRWNLSKRWLVAARHAVGALPRNCPDTQTNQRDAADERTGHAERRDLFEKHDRRHGDDDREIHHAAGKQQQHQRPAAAQACHPVTYA
jgi:hypothetical protein